MNITPTAQEIITKIASKSLVAADAIEGLRMLVRDDPSMPESLRQGHLNAANKLAALAPDRQAKLMAALSQMAAQADLKPADKPGYMKHEIMRPAHVSEYVLRNGRNLHNFTLSSRVVSAANYGVAHGTCVDLEKMGLLHLPYPAIWLTYRPDDFLDDNGWYDQDVPDKKTLKQSITCLVYDALSSGTVGAAEVLQACLGDHIYVHLDDGRERVVYLSHGVVSDQASHVSRELAETLCYEYSKTAVNAAACLLTALATRNVVKHTKVNKRAERGIGNGKFQGPEGTILLSTTVLDVPDNLESDAEHPANAGVSPKAHLRRGHVHTYLHGQGKALRKVQWTAPTFVNADPEFVAKARRYQVTG